MTLLQKDVFKGVSDMVGKIPDVTLIKWPRGVHCSTRGVRELSRHYDGARSPPMSLEDIKMLRLL